MERADVVIVGGGQAGASAALSLREFGYAGTITLICGEATLPYERPPLSKEFLLREKESEALRIAKEAGYAEQGVRTIVGCHAHALDTARSCLLLEDGCALQYSSLVLATGARLRRLSLPGSDNASVFYLRTLADAHALRNALVRGRRVAIVGGGFLGLEVATAARRLGCHVTVVEAGPRLMARAVAPFVSDYFRSLHERQGVEIRLDTGVRSIEGSADAVESLVLESGEAIPADVVVAGIGIDPEYSLANAAGLAVDDGILVDEQGRTSVFGVYACGDAARMRHTTRRETWQHAVDTARIVAASICGRPAMPLEVPWFWSDQAGVNFQMAGAAAGWTDVVVRGNACDDRFSASLLRDSHVVAVNTVNSGREMHTGRRWIKVNARVDCEKLRDPAVRLEACAL
jgi:3-phenylpropionate/trans-cinnamate dioxygenase ferredoxin reductase subunit